MQGGSSSEHRAEPLKKEHKKQVVAFCRSLWDSKVTSARVLVEPDSTWILSSVYQHCNFAGGLVARTVWDTVRLVYALKWAGQRGHALPEDVIDPVSTLASGVVSLMHQAQWCLQVGRRPTHPLPRTPAAKLSFVVAVEHLPRPCRVFVIRRASPPGRLGGARRLRRSPGAPRARQRRTFGKWRQSCGPNGLARNQRTCR